MDIKNIIDKLENVTLYEKGTHMMWTDEYISKQLLEMHINPNIDVASRSPKHIEKTIDWILEELLMKHAKLLDLGCGPGLYTERFAQKGYDVTGMDFSATSITYAKNKAKEKGLFIDYVCDNYLNLNYENEFDLIMMIYCDFGALLLEERNIVIENIYRALKPGGIFIFDALNNEAVDKLNFGNNWELSKVGFWSDKPYLALTASKHFIKEKAILDQHVVIDEVEEIKIYRFWNHYFNDEDVYKYFNKYNFTKIERGKKILSGDSAYDNVSFYKIIK